METNFWEMLYLKANGCKETVLADSFGDAVGKTKNLPEGTLFWIYNWNYLGQHILYHGGTTQKPKVPTKRGRRAVPA